MEIKIVEQNKKDFLSLLLLADEQGDMIDRYLERGTLFALYDNGLKSICVVTDEGEGVVELQSLATEPAFQRQGYGRRLVEYACEFFRPTAREMIVGTGDSPMTIPFYEECGFSFSHRIKDYFVEHYREPIIENGVVLRDKIYLKKKL